MVRNRRFALSAVAVAFGSFAGSAPASAAVIDDLFVFGDSYSDTGAFDELSNGPTWAGYLAQDFGITLTTSKNPDPGTDGVNFAESGARVFVGPTPPATQPRSLTQQVGEFQNDVTSDKVTFNPDSTLFFIEGGGNDHTGVTPAVTAGEVDAAITQQVTTLYQLGARLIEIALLPSDLPIFGDSASNFNPGYAALVAEFQTEFPNAVFGLSNWGPDYDYIFEHPSVYNISNTTDQCINNPACTTPDTYFYYFGGHPSTFVHDIVGNDIYKEVLALPAPVPEPTAWAMLLIGFGLLGLLGYRKTRSDNALA